MKPVFYSESNRFMFVGYSLNLPSQTVPISLLAVELDVVTGTSA